MPTANFVCSVCQRGDMHFFSISSMPSGDQAELPCEECNVETLHTRVWDMPAMSQVPGAGRSPARGGTDRMSRLQQGD